MKKVFFFLKIWLFPHAIHKTTISYNSVICNYWAMTPQNCKLGVAVSIVETMSQYSSWAQSYEMTKEVVQLSA